MKFSNLIKMIILEFIIFNSNKLFELKSCIYVCFHPIINKSNENVYIDGMIVNVKT